MTPAPASLLDTALAYWQAGLTPIPHAANTEGPSYLDRSGRSQTIAWGVYKDTHPDRATIERWFQAGDFTTVRLELVTGSGPVSKYEAPARLQILDLERADIFEAFVEDLHFNGHGDILYRCVIERTPSGGGHIGFLCAAISDKPKVKLAERPGANGSPTPLIELLQHSLCTVAPTQIAWKPDRPADATYHLVQGTWAQPYVISAAQRTVLVETARVFNEVPPKVVGDHQAGRGRGEQTGPRPGDQLNEEADLDWWRELLTQHSWREVSRPSQTRRGMAAFQRPGKVGGRLSATYGKTGMHLYVFSSNAQPFEPDTAYTPFAAYALLRHDGDYGAAAKALAQQYGITLLKPARPSYYRRAQMTPSAFSRPMTQEATPWRS